MKAITTLLSILSICLLFFNHYLYHQHGNNVYRTGKTLKISNPNSIIHDGEWSIVKYSVKRERDDAFSTMMKSRIEEMKKIYQDKKREERLRASTSNFTTNYFRDYQEETIDQVNLFGDSVLEPSMNLTKLTPPYLLLGTDNRFRHIRFLKFTGNVQVPWDYYHPIRYKTEKKMVTLVVTGEQIDFQYYIENWSDPILFIISVSNAKEREVIDAIEHSSHTFPNRVETIVLSHPKKSPYFQHYPINVMRNLGLMFSHSALVLIIDSTKHISPNLVTEIKKVVVPKYSILLIPTVFTTSSSFIPQTKQEVNDCVSKKTCFLNKPGEKTYNYVDQQWLHDSSTVSIVPCFTNLELEPSFVVRISPILPSYNDGFIDYGFGQIAYFEHLRLRGFHMQLIGNAFLVETPHEISSYQMEFNRQYVERGNSTNEVLYNALKKRWSVQYKNIEKTVSVCK